MKEQCRYAKSCGGCGGAGRDYGNTLREKQEYLQGLLGGFARPEPIIGADDPYHYRCKVHRVLSRDRKGRVLSGIYRAGTHQVIGVDGCLIEDLTCQRVADAVRDLAVSFRLRIFDEDRGDGFLRHVVVRRGLATGEVMVILVTASPVFPGKQHFLQALLGACPEITTVVQNLNSRRTTMVLGEKNITLFGPGFIQDRLCGLTFRLGPVSFFQVNPAQTEILYRTAVGFADPRPDDVVVDAYCGTGTIGLTAARSAGRLIGAELNAAAVRDAKLNAQSNGIANAEFVQADAGDFMARMTARHERADIVLMDPPRSGSTERFLSACAAAAPRTVVYISCGPESLKRDLLFLTKHGYAVRKIQPVDMFPFTEHIETVVLLSKGEIDSKRI